MVRLFIPLVFLAMPTIAFAQQTNTTCTSIGGTVTCNSTTNPTIGQVFSEDLKRREKADERRAESLDSATAEVERFAARQRETLLRKKVGQLVAEGRCDDAKKLALENGELELAAATKNLCE